MIEKQYKPSFNFSRRGFILFIGLPDGIFEFPVLVNVDGRTMNSTPHGNDHVE